jgi:hypothetical protein
MGKRTEVYEVLKAEQLEYFLSGNLIQLKKFIKHFDFKNMSVEDLINKTRTEVLLLDEEVSSLIKKEKWKVYWDSAYPKFYTKKIFNSKEYVMNYVLKHNLKNLKGVAKKICKSVS